MPITTTGSSFKPIQLVYSAPNFATGLTDITANIHVNGVAKGTLAMTALDPAAAPGVYTYTITSAQQLAWSVVSGASLTAFMSSASRGGKVEYKVSLTTNSDDDIAEGITSARAEISSVQATINNVNNAVQGPNGVAVINAGVNAVQATVNNINNSAQSGVSGFAAIMAAIQGVQSQVSSISNNTFFSAYVPAGGLVKPTSGSQTYRIPLNVQNDSGVLVDPVSNSISCSIASASGADLGSLMVGYSGGSAPAVRDAVGNYHIDVNLTPSEAEQGVVFSFNYSIGSTPFLKKAAATILNNIQDDGYAQQATAAATLALLQSSNVDQIIPLLTGANGLANINANATTTNTNVLASTALLQDATVGLAAANTLQLAIQTAVSNAMAAIGLVQGSGFNTTTDALAAISQRVYTGGSAS
jgi:hypothetical protein